MNVIDPTAKQLIEMTENRHPGIMVYQGYIRHFCPHLVGLTQDARVVVHAYQFGGNSSKGDVSLEKGAGWRFFYLDEIQDLAPYINRIGGVWKWYPEDLQRSLDAVYQPPKFIQAVWAIAP